MIQFGLVTLTVAVYVALMLNTSPITFDLHARYAAESLCVLAIIAGLAVFGSATTRVGSIGH